MSMTAPPGWYDDPTGQSRRRWWNGQAWSMPTAETTPQPSASRRGKTANRVVWVVLALMLAFGAIAGLMADNDNGGSSVARSSTVDREAIFRTFVRQNTSLNPASSVSLARTTCQQLDDGVPLAGLIGAAYGANVGASGDTQASVMLVLGAGIEAFCPQYSDDVKRLANA